MIIKRVLKDEILLNFKSPKTIDKLNNRFREQTNLFNFSKKCKFPNCNHKNDQGCAVMKALRNGEIEESRYNNFIVLSQKN